MQRRIYIYQPKLNKEIIDLFSMIRPSFIVEHVEDDILTVLDKDYYNEEPFDIESLCYRMVLYYGLFFDRFSIQKLILLIEEIS